jgi:hypothetical protein
LVSLQAKSVIIKNKLRKRGNLKYSIDLGLKMAKIEKIALKEKGDF